MCDLHLKDTDFVFPQLEDRFSLEIKFMRGIVVPILCCQTLVSFAFSQIGRLFCQKFLQCFFEKFMGAP